VVGDEARRRESKQASNEERKRERDLQRREEDNADIELKRKGKIEIGERRKESSTRPDSAIQLARTQISDINNPTKLNPSTPQHHQDLKSTSQKCP
jgi:hypothetical protein